MFGITASGIQTGSNWDIDDDFTSYTSDANFASTYVTANSARAFGDASEDYIRYLFAVQTDAQSLVRDFGSTISDTAWICRFKWKITLKQTNNTGYAVPTTFGWTDKNQTFNANDNCDGIGLNAYQDNLARNFWSVYADGSAFHGSIGSGSNGTQFSRVASNGADLWIQEVRDSATQTTVGIYDNEYTSVSEAKSTTIPSTITGLRYFKMASSDCCTQSTGKQEGYVHQYLKFEDGATTPP